MKSPNLKLLQYTAIKNFKSTLQDFANNHNITLLYAPSQSQIPRAEMTIRTIKERVRSLFHNLTYSAMPKTVLKNTLSCKQQLQ